MFEWVDRIQSYYNANTEWDYMDELYKFVDGGMKDEVFIDSLNRIVAKGCHLVSCDSDSSIHANYYRYGFEKKQNMINILKLVFNLPAATSPSDSLTSPPLTSEATIPNIYADMDALKQFFPSSQPTASPSEATTTVSPTQSPLEYQNTDPTSSPVEFSNITVFNDGGKYIIDDNVTSFADGESLVLTDKTKLTLIGGTVAAPDNSAWPAIRLSIGSIINASSGVVKGSNVGETHDEGGEAIQLNNGQSSTETGE